MTPTRIAIVLDSHWDALMGGAQYQVRGLVELLRARPGVALDFVARFLPRDAHWRPEGYRPVRFGSDSAHGRLRMLLDMPSLYRTLRTLHPDVVYQRCLMPFTGVCAAYCRRRGARFVFHVASDRDVVRLTTFPPGLRGLLHRVARRIAEYGLRRADVIVVQTDDQARALERDYGRRADLVVRNFTTATPQPRQPRDDSRPLRVAWIANFKPLKRPERFVAVAEALRQRGDIEFLMIGRRGPPGYAALHERIATLSNTRYLGELPVDQVDAVLAECDLLVNTSEWEGFPNTFLQAWACGIPVITDGVDPDGCLSRHGAGRVVGSTDEFVRTIEAYADDRATLRRDGDAARAHGMARHGVTAAGPLLDLLTTTSQTAPYTR